MVHIKKHRLNLKKKKKKKLLHELAHGFSF